MQAGMDRGAGTDNAGDRDYIAAAHALKNLGSNSRAGSTPAS